MKKAICSLNILAALVLASCGGDKDSLSDPNVLVDANFDTLAGWIPESQSATLSRAQAHSGHYALIVDGTKEYSLGFHAPLVQLSPTRIKKIKVSAWVFVSAGDGKAVIVSTVGNPAAPNDKPLLWDAIDLGKGIQVGKWVEVEKVITLPEAAGPTNVLGFYLWRTGGSSPIYLDDLRVTLEP